MTTYTDPRRADALRLGARNGSPFASDRAFRRPVSRRRYAFRLARDFLACVALAALAMIAAALLASTGHWA